MSKQSKSECVLCGRTDRECVPVVGRTGVTQMMCGGEQGCAGPVLERLQKTKTDLYYDQCVKNWEVEGNDWRKDAVFLKELHGNLDVTGWTQTFEDQFPEGERPEGPLTAVEVIALVKRLRKRFPWEGGDEEDE